MIFAIFADPTPGQENVPGNCIWGPSTLPPWGSGWKHPDTWPAGLRDDLPDDWRPTPALDALKAAKWEAVKAERDRREAGGFEYLGNIFDSDPTSVIRLTVAVAAARSAISAGQTGLSFAWTLQDNTVATLSVDEFIGLPLALAANANDLHQHARVLRERIYAATTAEEIQAIPDW
ncbi:DUF4376 domain-containing protein [Anaeroselena agilis]|uniref:DUF4376 domain-containing protein n=1 Tax=Anaeroselena agilis TaxID=3063788 RepID=A0ABU3NWI6_9FIRM|nr:DUF4376 domain-containing protein [Selenomonadales bacterium 4137-cl]